MSALVARSRAASDGVRVKSAARSRPAAPVRAEAARPARAAPAADSFHREVAPLMQKYCAACHGAQNPSSGLALMQFRDTAAVVKAHDLWGRVAQNVASSAMPPKGLPQPTAAERSRIVAWIESTLSTAGCEINTPGRVTMRRLNREEYNNTIRDLLHVTVRPADSFPSDDVGYGFDNIGDVLSISPLLMEKYLTAAEQAARAAIVTPESSSPVTRWEGDALTPTGGEAHQKGRILPKVSELSLEHEFPKAGEYFFRARAFGQQAGAEPTKLAFRLDGKNVRVVDVTATEVRPDLYQVRLTLPAGKRKLSVAFINDFYRETPPEPPRRRPRIEDRNLVVTAIEVQGPLELHGPLPESHRRLFGEEEPTAASATQRATTILGAFARRAYRRPVTAAEVARLVRISQLAIDAGESFERGIQLAVQAALVSPHFLFRVETSPGPRDSHGNQWVGQYEMASRLSYFLWSSMPDEALLALAAQGKLQDPAVLAAQVKRMLKDPKARALGDNFAMQWLTLRRIREANPDPERFPGFNDALRQAMLTETALFFQEVVQKDRSVLDFLDGRFTYVNEVLAKHYGLSGVQGESFRRVTLDGTPRKGLLTQASVLTVTSNPTRTSPVKRGKWVLEQLLGTPPPPPPPDVPELADDKHGPLVGTLRQRMEQHRENPSCASCHARMDPIGFGLENFDAVGRWRTTDGGEPIDASGELPGGKRFSGPAQLITLLKAQEAQFTRNLTEKLLTYALGRGIEPYDRCNVTEIAERVGKAGHRFSALATEVVLSEPFRKRQVVDAPRVARR
jgi:mono/diheme cytochrome c family protein